MIRDAPRIPSVGETVRVYARRFVFGDSFGWVGAIVSYAVLIVVAVSLPPIGSVDLPVFMAPLIVLGAGLHAAYREYRFGGPTRLVVAAGVTTAVFQSLLVSAFVAVWATFGGRLGIGPLDWMTSLPTEALVAGLLGLAVVLVILYFLRKPARERTAAAYEAEVRAERVRRGRAPAA